MQGGGGDEDGGGDDLPPRRRRRTDAEEDEEKQKRREDEKEREADDFLEEKTPSPTTRRRRRSSAAMEVESPQNKRRVNADDAEEDVGSVREEGGVVRGGGRSGPVIRGVGVEEEVAVGSERGIQFVRLLGRQFMEEGVVAVEDALDAINGEIQEGRKFTRGEAEGLLMQLEAANKVMYREGSIYRI